MIELDYINCDCKSNAFEFYFIDREYGIFQCLLCGEKWNFSSSEFFRELKSVCIDKLNLHTYNIRIRKDINTKDFFKLMQKARKINR